MNIKEAKRDKVELSLTADPDRIYLYSLIAPQLGCLARAAFWVRMTWAENLKENPLKVRMPIGNLIGLRRAIDGRIEQLLPKDAYAITGTEEQLTLQQANQALGSYANPISPVTEDVPYSTDTPPLPETPQPEIAA